VTTFLLIRHGSTAAVGTRLAGRLPGSALDDEGRAQAARLAWRLRASPLAAVCSSPMPRALETAAPLASQHGLEIQQCAGLDEIDFGDWSGRTFAELDPLPTWRQFNSIRSCTRIPGGEHICEVQVRVVSELERIQRDYPHGTVVLVSHADVLRAALAYYAAIPIDLFLRIEISPASISTLQLDEGGPRILNINCTEPPGPPG
jgi:broad specificity phosphatase PhoE